MASAHPEKPPLPYWLVAFSYKVFGVNEFATRVPMVLSVLLLGVLAFCRGGARSVSEQEFMLPCLSTRALEFTFSRAF